MLDILKELCAIDGTSGHEDKVRDYIIKHIGDNKYTVDNLGNLIVEVKGKKEAKNKVMLCAHMDEVGIIATSILDNGLIKFITVGTLKEDYLREAVKEYEKRLLGFCIIYGDYIVLVISCNLSHK